MVTISSKAASRRRNARIKLVAASSFLLLLLLIGCYLLQWFTTSILSTGNANNMPPSTGIKGSPQSKQRILASLAKLNNLLPLSPQNTQQESTFLTAATKECIPGRDDTGTEINPTTHRRRECLRHVSIGKQHILSSYDLEERMKMQRPRIGIMIPPGYITTTVATWIGKALKLTGDSIHMDFELLITAHVPVYGYGKSHGYSKLIRIVTLPLPLAVGDAYYYSMNELLTVVDDKGDDSSGNDGSKFVIQQLDAVLDETKVKYTPQPSSQTVKSITELLLRWHCRLSHVSAHTAELTLTLDNILKHPTDTLETILTYIWRQDWEWEGHNHVNKIEERELYPKIWKGAAEEFVSSEDGSLQGLLNQLSILLQDGVLSSLSTSDAMSFGESMQQSFASEMIKSKDMTSWPCPSFWDGVDVDKPDAAAYKIANEMTPNCRDGDPYARCTVNKDRCEVKRDAECK